MFDQEDLEQEFDLEDEEINEALKKEEIEETPEPELDHKEPAPKLHISKEDWVKQGRDPELWVPPEVFKERTQRINETSKLKQENARLRAERDEDARRLTNVAFLQQQQINRLRAELDQKRDDAIEIGDKAAVKAYDKQIKDLDTEESLIAEPKQVVQQVSIPAAVAEWNAKNDWLTADHPLRGLANETYQQAIDDGETVRAALKIVDAELARYKEAPAQKRVASKSIVDSPRGAVSRSESVTLKMSDCTREERDMYNDFWKSTGASEKDFLKDLAKIRAGN